MSLQWVFKYNGTRWNQYGTRIRDSASPSYFGASLALSSSGAVLAVGAPGTSAVGATYIYRDNGAAYVVEAGPLVGTGYTGTPGQGDAVAIDAAGTVVASGARLNNVNIGGSV